MKFVLRLCFLFFVVVSCQDIIDEPDITNEIVSVLAPTDGAILTQTDVSFHWSVVEGATEYHMQIATPNFATATQIVLDSTVTTNSFSKPLELGDYEWRVKAENANYQTEYSTQSFSIE